MLKEKERIESLRKTITTKKEKLGLNTDILYLKPLSKFNNLEEIKYPKSVTNSYYIYTSRDIKGRFEDVTYKNSLDSNKYDYVYGRIVAEVSKKVFADISKLIENLDELEVIEVINKYITDNTNLENIKLLQVEDEQYKEFFKSVLKSREKIDVNTVLRVENSKYNEKYDSYISYDAMIKKIAGSAYTGRGKFRGLSVRVLDIFSIIARAMILKSVNDYVFSDDNKFNFMKEKISSKLNCENDFFENISKELFVEILEDNHYSAPTFLKAIIVLSMEEMLRESFDIYQYEERLKSISGDYAKTYMTKKNIPKKTLEFMDNNNFLNMFGFVEADEDCELEKLNKLADEFKNLSEKLYLPRVKNHSLRFRKLGKIKALGVYYPGFNTLAVDLDGVSSFIHEMFHMIDFENDILSLDTKFKPLLDKYRALMDKYVDDLGKEHDTYKFWYESKSKYARGYYRSNEEAFARMGEIYVTDILKLNSSFAKIDYSSNIQKIVYPKNPELLDLIKVYYDELFMNIKKKFERVTFDESKNVVKDSNILKTELPLDNLIGLEQIAFSDKSKVKDKVAEPKKKARNSVSKNTLSSKKSIKASKKYSIDTNQISFF